MLPNTEEAGVGIKSGEQGLFSHSATWVEQLFPSDKEASLLVLEL